MNQLQQLDKWHKTRSGFLIFGLIELVLVYLFGSLAINSGSLWQWTLTFLLLIGGVSNIIQAFLSGNKVKDK